MEHTQQGVNESSSINHNQKISQYGGFWRRFAALFLDSLIVRIAFSWNDTLALLLGIAYFVWMNGAYGATIGKMILKLKIVKEDGSKINYSDALIRELASVLSFIVLWLGYLNVIWDKRKQGWHDKIAKTIVVRK